MIQAYPDQLSVLPAESLVLHIATDHPEFRVVLYRQGATLESIHDYGWQTTDNVGWAAGQADVDWDWDGYEFPIPGDARSGVYIAMLWERGIDGEHAPDLGVATTAGHYGKALFVVRSTTPGALAPILYRVPIATYHAYNVSGGKSLYAASPGRVTMHRPGGGTGGDVTRFSPTWLEDYDDLDTVSPRQTFEHQDAKFIRWLEAAGHRVDYCTDIDVHRDTGLQLLSGYGLVVASGHDEYWSAGMKANLAAYVAQGGNLAQFSGNTCWWRIHYDDDESGFACLRAELTDPNVDESDQWWLVARRTGVQNENALIGVSYRNAAGWWWPGRPLTGYVVERPEHWVFEGGVDNEFGAPQSLVGYECDGAELAADPARRGTPTYSDGTPPNFRVLAIGPIVDSPNGSWSYPPRAPDSPTAAAAPRAATMGLYTDVGTVFNAATVDWPRVLEQGEPNVERITRTVLSRLGGIIAGRATLGSFPGVIALDGFHSTDDNYRHIVLATNSGLTEVFFHPQHGQGVANLGAFPGVIDVSAFFTADDNYRHAIVLTGDGTLTEVFFHPRHGQGQVILGTFPQASAIAGFFTADDGYRHVMIVAGDGTLTEVFFHPRHGQGQAHLGVYPGAIDVGAFHSTDDNYRHAVILANDEVHEVFFHPAHGQSQVTLGSVPGGVRVAGFYADDDANFNRRVVVAANDGRVHELRFSTRTDLVRSVIANVDGLDTIAAFQTPDDRNRHVILGSTGGAVEERFYRP